MTFIGVSAMSQRVLLAYWLWAGDGDRTDEVSLLVERLLQPAKPRYIGYSTAYPSALEPVLVDCSTETSN
jgi:hypothetical protein